MDDFTLEVLLEGEVATGWVVRSPTVGVWSDIPAGGAALDGRGAGRLTRAGRRFRLTLPEEIGGRVDAGPARGRRQIEVEWGQELFRIEPLGGKPVKKSRTTAAKSAARDVLPAPSDGVFYVRSSPDAAPFVGVGDAVRRGQPVGLIEVMKTFNHVLFEGPTVPATATVAEILVPDGHEVRAGDALLRYEPAG